MKPDFGGASCNAVCEMASCYESFNGSHNDSYEHSSTRIPTYSPPSTEQILVIVSMCDGSLWIASSRQYGETKSVLSLSHHSIKMNCYMSK